MRIFFLSPHSLKSAVSPFLSCPNLKSSPTVKLTKLIESNISDINASGDMVLRESLNFKKKAKSILCFLSNLNFSLQGEIRGGASLSLSLLLAKYSAA